MALRYGNDYHNVITNAEVTYRKRIYGGKRRKAEWSGVLWALWHWLCLFRSFAWPPERMPWAKAQEGRTPEPPVRFSEPCCLFALYPSVYDANHTGGYDGSKKMGCVKSVSLGSGRLTGERMFSSCRKLKSRKGNFCACWRDGNLHLASETQPEGVLFREKETPFHESSNYLWLWR